ncbi:MAG: isochorismatase family protein [Acidobacteriota bacterium]|nr:isochorismatase family protein [Acidobacteriota bacterium]
MTTSSGSPTPRAHVDSTALLVIDVQRDFCVGGALAVPAGDQVVPVLNRVLAAAHERRLTCYATRDWHPANSQHFLPRGPWPVHCVAGTTGARFHPDLGLPTDTVIVNKGTEVDGDGYSAFDGCLDAGSETVLADDLARRDVTHLVIGGFATDYCVRASVLDALTAGFDVTLLLDAVAAVDQTAGDGQRALDEMRAAGATLTIADTML